MPPRERAIDRGTNRGLRSIDELGRELREARLAANLTQSQVAKSVGISPSYAAKIERAEARHVSVVLLSRMSGVVGLELTMKAYPGGSPLRDVAHIALLSRFRARLHHHWTWRTEVPIPLPRDQRSWDAVLSHGGLRIGIEAETRLRDVQAVDRRIGLKLRDSGFDRALLVLSDTRSNRTTLRSFGDALRPNFPVRARIALDALAAGLDPGGSAVIVV